jgi:hypothetical protein
MMTRDDSLKSVRLPRRLEWVCLEGRLCSHCLCADASTKPTNKSSASLNETMQYRKIIAKRFTYHFVIALWRIKKAESAA